MITQKVLLCILSLKQIQKGIAIDGMFMSPQVHMLMSNPKMMVFVDGNFGRCLGREGGALLN